MIDPEDIAEEIAAMSGKVSPQLPTEAEELLNAGRERSQWLVRVGELEAEAQRAVDVRRGEVADTFAELTATLYRDKLAGETADLSRLVMLSHRLYTTITEQIEWIRTEVSYRKTQWEHSGRFEAR